MAVRMVTSFVWMVVLCTLCILIEFGSCANPSASSEERSFLIEHAFGLGQPFRPRGKVTLRFRSRGAVSYDKAKFSAADVKDFKSIVDADDLYRIRLVPIASNEETTTSNEDSYVTNFVKACALRTSGFRETMLFHADVYGNVVAVDYNTALTKCQPGPVPNDIQPQTKGKITMGRAGDKPKDTRVLERKAQEQAARAANEPGFIGKYWMYMLPIALVFMFGGGGG